MDKARPDVIEILEMEKKYHADQIRRINVAIAALKGETSVEEIAPQKQSPQKTTKAVQWTAKIKEIFDNNDVLSIEQTRDKLVEKGIVEAMTGSGKNSIYSTFSRLKKIGYLEQPEYGKYRKKQPKAERLPRKIDAPNDFTRGAESNEGSEPSKHPEPSY
jgi:hypothetical protein